MKIMQTKHKFIKQNSEKKQNFDQKSNERQFYSQRNSQSHTNYIQYSCKIRAKRQNSYFDSQSAQEGDNRKKYLKIISKSKETVKQKGINVSKQSFYKLDKENVDKRQGNQGIIKNDIFNLCLSSNNQKNSEIEVDFQTKKKESKNLNLQSVQSQIISKPLTKQYKYLIPMSNQSTPNKIIIKDLQRSNYQYLSGLQHQTTFTEQKKSRIQIDYFILDKNQLSNFVQKKGYLSDPKKQHLDKLIPTIKNDTILEFSSRAINKNREATKFKNSLSSLRYFQQQISIYNQGQKISTIIDLLKEQNYQNQKSNQQN